MFVAAAARPRRLGPLGRGSVAAGAAESALRFLLLGGSSRFELRRSFGGAAGFFLGLHAGLFDSLFLGLAILFGPATFFLGLFDLGAILAAARFLKGGQARFLGFAKQL